MVVRTPLPTGGGGMGGAKAKTNKKQPQIQLVLFTARGLKLVVHSLQKAAAAMREVAQLEHKRCAKSPTTSIGTKELLYVALARSD